jgi:hypothetical protein
VEKRQQDCILMRKPIALRTRKRLPFVLAIALLVLSALVHASPAQAAFILLLDAGGGNTAIATGTSPLMLSGPLGGSVFTINVTTATSSSPAIPGQQSIDLNSINVAASGPGTLTITTYATGDMLPPGAAVASSSIGGTIDRGATITAHSWFDPSNTGNTALPPAFGLPGAAVPIMTFGSYMPPPIGFSDNPPNVGMTVPSSGAFALIAQTTVTFAGAGSVSYGFSTHVTATPAPAGLVMALSALPFVGLGYWRKRRSVRAA